MPSHLKNITASYLEKLEVKHNIDKALRDDKKRNADRNDGDGEKSQGNSKKKNKKDKKNGSKANLKRDKACVHCDKWHPAPDDQCWSLDKNKNKRPTNKGPPTERMFTALQMEQIAKALSAKASKSKKKKRKVSSMSKVDDSSDNSFSSESESYCPLLVLVISIFRIMNYLIQRIPYFVIRTRN